MQGPGGLYARHAPSGREPCGPLDEGTGAFIDSNVSGNFQLLQAVRAHWEGLLSEHQSGFRCLHIITDEVFGSLDDTCRFSETTPYYPRRPYSASKAACDHLVNACHRTYDQPVVLTNCSNSYGPGQFPEKVILEVVPKAAAGEPIPLYGDGSNVRDWLYFEEQVNALLMAAYRGWLGNTYCVGDHGECSNKHVVEAIGDQIDQLQPEGTLHVRLITQVIDRPSQDRRYPIDPARTSTELGWHLEQQGWCRQVGEQDGYTGSRTGSPENTS